MFCDCNVVFRAALTAASEGKAHPTTAGNRGEVELPIKKQKPNALVSLRDFESWIVPLATLIWSSIRGGDRHHHVCAFWHCKGLSPSPPMPSLRSKVSSTMHIQRLSPSPPLACAGAVCLLIITTTFVAASRHLSSLPISLGSRPRCPSLLSAPPRGPRSGHALHQTRARPQLHGGRPAWHLRDVLSLPGVWAVVPARCWLGSSLPRCPGLV